MWNGQLSKLFGLESLIIIFAMLNFRVVIRFSQKSILAKILPVDYGRREGEKYSGNTANTFFSFARLQIYLHYRIESFERRLLSIFRKTDFSLRFMYRRENTTGNFSIPFAAKP